MIELGERKTKILGASLYDDLRNRLLFVEIVQPPIRWYHRLAWFITGDKTFITPMKLLRPVWVGMPFIYKESSKMLKYDSVDALRTWNFGNMNVRDYQTMIRGELAKNYRL